MRAGEHDNAFAEGDWQNVRSKVLIRKFGMLLRCWKSTVDVKVAE